MFLRGIGEDIALCQLFGDRALEVREVELYTGHLGIIERFDFQSVLEDKTYQGTGWTEVMAARYVPPALYTAESQWAASPCAPAC